ncbi:MAG: mycothiol synthase [Acidimicrobiales bacterium]
MDEFDVTVSQLLDPATAVQVEALRSRVEARDGHDPFSEHKRRLLGRSSGGWPPDGVSNADPGADPDANPDADGFVAVVAWVPGDDRPVGYAQLNPGGPDGSLALELMVSPDHRDPDLTVADALLGAALRAAGDSDGPVPTVRYWSHHAAPEDDRLAAAHGLRVERELIQMRRPLPVGGDRSDISVRGFIPGLDEQGWLEVNNRAFASHPEQGGWDLGTLLEQERQPWFDPEGLRVHEEDGRLAASCWTKVHTDTSPVLGEIYVLSVDPEFRGRGLGRAMTLAGLDWLAGAGIRVGMLYVDSANRAAVSLYRSVGFTDHHVDRAYLGTAERAPAASPGEAARRRPPGP